MRKRLVVALALSVFSSAGASHRQAHPIQRSLAQCPWHGSTVSLPDTGIATLAIMDDVTVRGGYASNIDASAVVITFSRGNQLLMKKNIEDMSNPNGFAAQSDDRRWLALNSSNGGAAGGWSVSIFHLEADGEVTDLSSSMHSVVNDFESRHYCRARGNNYEAFQWRRNGELLLTAEVYGTSDCGNEMGYTEGYVLQPSTGKILHHYTAQQLLSLPGVCIWNWDTR